MASFWDFFTGSPAKRENVSNLLPNQQGLHDQAVNAGLRRGAGGAFGDAADYYRNLLSDNSADYNAFAAPMLRQYNEEIVPGISEQFAGMGAGGLSSSGFRNAQIQGATDLSERLGAIRANLRHAGAQGLQNIGQVGLQNVSTNMETQPGSEGILAPLAGAALTAVGGPVVGALGTAGAQGIQNWFNGKGSKVGANTSPYGGGSGAPQASPKFNGQSNSQFGLPGFNSGMRGY